MAHGFNDDKTKSSFEIETLVNNAVSNAVSTLQNKITNYWKTVYPVGSIYITTNGTSPATLFGGTWEAYGAGKVLVGLNSADNDFKSVGKTGGTKTQNIRIDYQHDHDIFIEGIPGTHSAYIYTGAELDGTSSQRNYVITPEVPVTAEDVVPGKLQDIPVRRVVNPIGASVNGSTVGETQTVNKLQPYITVRMWRRTA